MNYTSEKVEAHGKEITSPLVGDNGSIIDGIFTVSSPKGGHRTFKISTQKEDASFAPGKQVISLLVGPDNWSNYKGFGFVNEAARVLPWKKTTEEQAKTGEALLSLLRGEEKLRNLGYSVKGALNCRRCGRLLTHPESLERGIGPECAGRG